LYDIYESYKTSYFISHYKTGLSLWPFNMEVGFIKEEDIDVEFSCNRFFQVGDNILAILSYEMFLHIYDIDKR
jgi:hypothetical protein